jgi:hypothetical protein
MGTQMKALLVAASLCLGAAPAMARDDNPNIDAVWLPQVVNFTYQADYTYYSCIGLWQKISGILAHLGARKTAPFQRTRCSDFAPTVSLQIALESPAEATEENLHAITDYDSKDLLVARLQGKQLPTANDIPHFPAAWTTRSTRDADVELSPGDCELLRQLRKQVLPKLSVQVLKEPARCPTTLSRSGLAPLLKVRALTVAG